MEYEVELTAAKKRFDGHYSWCHPRAGTIPPKMWGSASDQPLVVLTMHSLLLSYRNHGAGDAFYGLNEIRTEDGGITWSEPVAIPGFERQPFPEQREVIVSDFTPAWHAASGKLLGTGHTVVYKDNHPSKVRPRATAYAARDPLSGLWSDWKSLVMPDEPRFANAGAGSTQRLDLPNGDILLPIYFKEPASINYAATVVRCRFDGTTLEYLEHGTELTTSGPRGFGEPSITKFDNRYYLTIRNDSCGYVASSENGLHFGEARPWTWEDGSELGNYNTQQHWISHPRGLFLIYTRRGANNDFVFRHRAPLFIAQVNTDTLQIMRHTEKILIPNRGARLGNFAVTQVSADEFWVTDAEWMEPEGCEQHGSDGSVWVAKVRF